jgi:uncharacterized membrane protein YbhN (UPF0104 family)
VTDTAGHATPPATDGAAPAPDGAAPASGRPDGAAAPAVAPPSRRAALLRTGLIVGVLVVVFGLILPQYIDYRDVIAAFQDLTAPQFLAMTILGVMAWVVSGMIFSALIDGLSVVRGTMSWLILAGIGASVPLGPWNMGVLWVVVRGWGIRNGPATSGIALYGITNILGRMALPLIGIAALAIAGDLSGRPDAGAAWTIAIISGVAFVAITALIIAIVRSERIAATIGRTGQRLSDWLMRRLGRSGSPDVEGAIGRFRDQLGQVIRRRGAAAIGMTILSQVAWAFVLVAALRVVGVPERAISAGEVFGIYALVMVVTIIPIAPGGAGVPELLFISGFTALTGGAYQAEITAGVFLYRLYFWFVPIPIAWALMKLARRGKPILPGTAELREYARSEAA